MALHILWGLRILEQNHTYTEGCINPEDSEVVHELCELCAENLKAMKRCCLCRRQGQGWESSLEEGPPP